MLLHKFAQAGGRGIHACCRRNGSRAGAHPVFGDSLENIEGALHAGLQAIHVQSAACVSKALFLMNAAHAPS